MLELTGLLLFGFCWLEYNMLKDRPAVRNFLKKHSKFQILLSIGLSYVVGLAFPAAGIMVIIAAIISTVVMNKVWHNYQYVEAAQTKVAEVKADLLTHKEEYLKTAAQVGKGIQVTGKMIIFPFKMIGMTVHGINTAKNKVQDINTKINMKLGGK